MAVIKGILTFPKVFTAQVPKGATEPKFSTGVLLPPTDPQIPQIQAEVNEAKANTFPSGFPAKADLCFMAYDEKFAGKDYYDPRFSGWWIFTCTAKQDDRPAVVDMNYQPVMPDQVFSGCIAYVNAGVSGYTKGTGGVGGWLNGVMVTDEIGQFGRLDGKPSVDQMFASVAGGAAPQQPAPPTAPQPVTPPPAAPAPAAPPQPPVPPAAPAPSAVHQMTAAANGVTYEAYKANGWSDEQLIQNGLMLPPGGVAPSFS